MGSRESVGSGNCGPDGRNARLSAEVYGDLMGTPRGLRSPTGKRERNYKRARSRREALERRALQADGLTNEDAARP